MLNETYIELAFLIVFIIAALLGFGCGYRLAKQRKRRDEEMCQLMYSLIRKSNALDDTLYSLKEEFKQNKDETSRVIERINALGSIETKNANTISSLTSSINNTLQEYRKRSEEKIYPTPQLSEMISTTIGEFIRQEISMIRDMRIPMSPEDPVTVKITRNVIRTYPHVDEEWIAKKVIQIVTEASRE